MPTKSPAHLAEEIVAFDHLDRARQAQCRQQIESLAEADEPHVERLLDALLAKAAGASEPRTDRLLAAVFEQLGRRYRPAGQDAAGGAALSGQRVAQLAELYRRLGAASNVRHHLLRVLAAAGGDLALETFVDCVVSDPPSDARHADLAFAPLFQQRRLAMAAVFPRLLAGIENPATAVQILDIANVATRRRAVEVHPAAGRFDQLLSLFSGLVNHLQDLEYKPSEYADTPRQLGETISRSVELMIALSQALALIGDDRAIGRLRQAMELSHRRVRIEAASALATLGDSEGAEMLIELAADPVSRCRAIRYLEEIGLRDRVPEEQRTVAAMAEGELAAWLAEPSGFGLAPHEIELIDHRVQHWPGYDDPQDCFLFAYAYHLPGGALQGVGIAGPVVHAFSTDLSDLEVADIYAMYAGWHASHTSDEDVAAENFSASDHHRADEAAAELESIGYDNVRIERLGRFLGEEVAVAAAQVAGESGVVISCGDRLQWFADTQQKLRLRPDELYCLFKGQAMLAAFN